MRWPWAEKKIPDCQVVLYTRAGCHLCETAHGVLDRARARFDFALREVDIAGDAELEAAHGEQIPVVTVDGTVRFRGCVNEVLLTRLLRARGKNASEKRR